MSKVARLLSTLVLVTGFSLAVLASPPARVEAQATDPSAPVLFFSDLESGPKTGWEGSATKGAAVSIWGKNFGSSRGSSYVTVSGAQLNGDSDYAEWGAIGPARHLERITFWLNSNCQDGAGEITLTVNGITSNSLPFTVRNGNIYFIAKDGSDSNDGRYASSQGGSNGPWLSFYMSHGRRNDNIQAGDIVYVREGTYNDIDSQGFMVYLGESNGGTAYEPGRPLAVIGYPGEEPILGPEVDTAVWGRPNPNAYLEWHKLIWESPSEVFEVSGHHFRIVGNIFRNNLGGGGGVIKCNTVWDWEIYGNLWQNNGHDDWKHGIYLSGDSSGNPGLNHDLENIDFGWNEFDHYLGWVEGANFKAGGGIVEIKNQGAGTLATHDIWVHDNLYHECTASPLWVTQNSYDIYFYNNVMWDTLHYTNGSSQGTLKFSTSNDDDRFYVFNNTFYDMGSDAVTVGSDGRVSEFSIAHIQISGSGTVQSKNNIFYSINNQPYLKMDTSRGASFVSENDIFFGNGPPPSGRGITVTNPITVDPQFISITNHNFRLASTSPGIDAGTSSVNSLVSSDFDGLPRPMGSGIDIGAYEFIAGGVPTPTFADVSFDHWAHDYIEALYQAGYTSGCNTSPLMYCPERILDRAEGAVFTIRGVHGADFTPPQPTEQIFADTLLTDWSVDWVTQLWEDGYTAGCSTNPLIFCPWQSYNRAEGAVFALRMNYGTDYVPPDPAGIFTDVSTEDWFIEWVEAAYNEGLIPACQEEPLQFCPSDPLDRAMAAYMTVQAKDIPVP